MVKFKELLCLHCWHKVAGSERKIKRRTRCRKDNPYTKKKLIKVHTIHECCICNKRVVKITEELEEIARNYPDLIGNNIYVAINEKVSVFLRSHIRAIQELQEKSFSIEGITFGVAPFSLDAIQFSIEEAQTGKQPFLLGLLLNRVVKI